MLAFQGSAAAADARKENEASTLARKGTAAIEHRRFGEALDAFTRASALQPDDATLCFGAGVAAFMLGQDEIAETRFACALALNPGYVQAAVWLGDLHYRTGRVAEAIRRTKPPCGAHRAEAISSHSSLPGAWSKNWTAGSAKYARNTSTHFSRRLLTNHSLVEAAERLESAYSRVGGTLGVYPSGRITVVLYTREQFTAITRLASWSAAAYDGRIRGPIGGTAQPRQELDRVLSHEFVHVLVAMLGGRSVPAWLNEGLATVLEPAGSEEAEAPLAHTRVRPDLSKLHQSFVDLSRRDAEVAYASAARAVRRLVEQHGANAIVALLQDLARGADFPNAFQQRIDMPVRGFRSALAELDTNISRGASPLGLPCTLARGGPTPRSAPVAHSLSLVSLRGASPLGLPCTLARGGPTPRSARRGSLAVARSSLRGASPLGLPCTLARGGPTPRSARRGSLAVARFSSRGFAPRTPLHARSRGPDAPLRSPWLTRCRSFLFEGLRPSDSPARSLAGARRPAPLPWLTRCRSFALLVTISAWAPVAQLDRAPAF